MVVSKPTRRQKIKQRTARPSRAAPARSVQLQGDLTGQGQKRLEIIVLALLFAFGIYQAIVFFGHQAVPSSDFPAFISTGKAILSFRLPGFKRLPMLGILQVLLSRVVGGQHPELTAGWLLNSIFHGLNIVLLYLVGKKLLGRSAVFFALLASLNPWAMQLVADPLVETTLIFFTLATFYFLMNGSRWCYLFAMLASMTRYEGSALIFAAFVIDVIIRKTKKQRLAALAFAATASIPFLLWLLATKLNWKPITHHYVGHFTKDEHVGLEYLEWLWKTTFKPLLQLPVWVKAVFVTQPTSQAQADPIIAAANNLFSISKFIASFGLIIGIGYGLIKRQKHLLALLIFLACYVGVHSMRMLTMHRYCVPVAWITLLLCCYGVQVIWRQLNSIRIPRPIVISLNLIITIAAAVWLIRLFPVLPATVSKGKHSALLPYMAVGIVAIIFVARAVIGKGRHLLPCLTISVLACLMLVSNHFTLVQIVGNGDKDREFKWLADWYVANAKKGELMVTTMPHIVELYAPKHRNAFRYTGSFRQETIQEFTEVCYEENITYIAWDSRIGLSPQDAYYKTWYMQKIAPLIRPRDLGPYKFIIQIKRGTRYINIFRLMPPADVEPG